MNITKNSINFKANTCQPTTPLNERLNIERPTSAQQSLNSNPTYNKIIRQKSNPGKFKGIVARSLRHSREASLVSIDMVPRPQNSDQI